VPPGDSDGWKEWSKYVLNKLGDLEDQNKTLNTKMDKVIIAVATLKVKAGIWGIMGGGIPIVILLGIWLLKGF